MLNKFKVCLGLGSLLVGCFTVAVAASAARGPFDAKARENAKKDYEQRSAAGIAAPGEGPDVFTVVEDYNSIDKLERLGNDLMKRGWTTTQVEKLLGRNLLRLYGEVWGG